LNELTARGVERVGLRQRGADAEVEELTQKLQAIGVVEGRALPALQPPRLIASGYGSGSIDPSSVTTAVEAELEKGDNRRKLAAAPEGATRHAFVWLHDSHWYVSSTLRDSGFPLPPAPLLPPEVDVGWVAVADGNPPAASTLLRVDASGIAAVDPTTGAALPLPQTTAAEGPPSQPSACPRCNSPSEWVVTRRARVDPRTGTRTAVAAWDAMCSADPAHYRRPGRTVSKRECGELGNSRWGCVDVSRVPPHSPLATFTDVRTCRGVLARWSACAGFSPPISAPIRCGLRPPPSRHQTCDQFPRWFWPCEPRPAFPGE